MWLSDLGCRRTAWKEPRFTEARLTKDLEVDGGIVFTSLVLSNADVLRLIVLLYLVDGQL